MVTRIEPKPALHGRAKKIWVDASYCVAAPSSPDLATSLFLDHRGDSDMKHIFLQVLFCILLGGCASGWTRPDTTYSQFVADESECRGYALQRLPPRIESGGGELTPIQTDCTQYGNSTHCTSTGGAAAPVTQQDANGFARALEIRSCLLRKGYKEGMTNGFVEK